MAGDWFDEGGTGNELDVAAWWDSGVPEALSRVVSAGALVSVGLTSDGGAVGVTVTLDGRWRREYFREAEVTVDWLLRAAEAVEASGGRRDAPSGSRKRSRRS